MAIAHDRNPVADLEQFVEVVRDVEDRNAGFLQCANDTEQHLDLVIVERGGRLIHDDQLGIQAK